MNKVLLLSITLVSLIFLGMAVVAEGPEVPSDTSYAPHAFFDDATFEGADRCKTCHRKPEDGEQFGIWQEGPHAKAYTDLASDKAKEVAAAAGVEGDPQQADACLKCHVTGHGVDAALLGTKYKIEDGVGCESCHGAGGNYYKKKTMEGISSGEIDAASVGLIQPTEEVCVTCHNEESPTFEGFNFEEQSAEIAHPKPE